MDWPAVLPLPVRDGFNRQYRTKMRQVKMDDGSSRGRRKFPAHAYTIKLAFVMNRNQRSIFDAFLKYDCAYGTAWFNIQIRPNTAKVAVKLTGNAPVITPQGMDWDVSFEVMTMNDLTFATPVAPNLTTLTAWPANIPLPNKDDYSTQMSDLFIEDNFDNGGKPNTRSRFTYKETVIQATWLLSAAERDRFFQFYKNQLLDGFLPVVMPFYSGIGMASIKCKFLEFPSEVSQDAAFKVTGKLSTFDVPVMTLAAYRLQVPAT